jgi:hypothetical protein
MKHLVMLLTLLLGSPVVTAAETQPDGAEPAQKVYAVVFDVASADVASGKQLADSIRLRLRAHDEYDVLDRLTTEEAAGPLAEADRDKARRLMARLASNQAIFGTLTQNGDAFQAEICFIDATGEREKPRQWCKTFQAEGQRARAVLAKQIVAAVRGEAEWIPPQYGDETEPEKFGAPLNRNGSFDAGAVGWDRPDNVSTFIEPMAGRGKILRIRTDLERNAWLAYRRQLMFGEADPANPPEIATDTSYGSVAGLEGVHYASHWIEARPGQRYWLTIDFRGKSGDGQFPRIFVKGFRKTEHAMDGLGETSLKELGITPAEFAALPSKKRDELIAADARKHPMRYVRECYRWYLACRENPGRWRHYAAPFPPRGGLPENVEYLQIQIYAYWPPATYLFDNCFLYPDPRQEEPVAEEPARTPNFGRTSDIVEQETSGATTQPAR